MVRELALQVGYEKVEFLDDNSHIAVGKVSEFGRFAGEFDEFIVAIGNPVVRHSCVEKLTGTFKLATIVHPLAYVSSEASVGSGCVVYRNVVLGECRCCTES